MAAITPQNSYTFNAGSNTLYIATFSAIATDTWTHNIAGVVGFWAVANTAGTYITMTTSGATAFILAANVSSSAMVYVLAQSM